MAILKPFLLPLAFPILVRGRGKGTVGLALGAMAPTLFALPWVGWRAMLEWSGHCAASTGWV
ncbi:MAG: hypothetical protein U0232_13220 [Thermomicrobiales bacterium]